MQTKKYTYTKIDKLKAIAFSLLLIGVPFFVWLIESLTNLI
jgi:hypothetical protein